MKHCVDIITGGWMSQKRICFPARSLLYGYHGPVEWLQWVLIPACMRCLIMQPLPEAFAITPYYEMALAMIIHSAIQIPLQDLMRYLPVMTPDAGNSHQDQWLVAVNKPSGWLVHRSWLDRDESGDNANGARPDWSARFTAHRLDRPTSGVLLMGRLSSRPDDGWHSSLSSIKSKNAIMRLCVAG